MPPAAPTSDPGVRIIHVDDLKVLLESSAQRGAEIATDRLLREFGIDPDDENDRRDVAKDFRELRGWVKAMRLARQEAFKTVVKWLTNVLLAVIAAGTIYLLHDKFITKVPWTGK